MLSFIVEKENIKELMNGLLRGDIFNSFEVREAQISSFITFQINGLLSHELTEKLEPKRYFVTWQEIKPICFDFIKGRAKPKSIKIVFSKDIEFTNAFHSNAAALFLNFNYENERDVATFTAATSQKEFALNKDIDMKWEEYILKFFDSNMISTHRL